MHGLTLTFNRLDDRIPMPMHIALITHGCTLGDQIKAKLEEALFQVSVFSSSSQAMRTHLSTSSCCALLIWMLPQQASASHFGKLKQFFFLFPGVDILVIDPASQPQHLWAAIQNGARGYLCQPELDQLDWRTALQVHVKKAGSLLSPLAAKMLIHQLKETDV